MESLITRSERFDDDERRDDERRVRSASLGGSEDDRGSDHSGTPVDDDDDVEGNTALLPSHKGPQTGVKGVRADAAHSAQRERERKAAQVRAVNAQMERMALGKSRTWKEDEEERVRAAEKGVAPKGGEAKRNDEEQEEEDDEDDEFDDDEEVRAIEMRRLQSINSQAAAQESRRKRLAGEGEEDRARSRLTFGHLREVGHDQYVQAVDGGGDASTYVVVHIYVKYVHACAMLTSALSSLARMHPKTKFIQVRAGKIGFGSGGLHDVQDEDVDEEELDEQAQDVVPTLLVYKAGKMVANLVRVDLDAAWGDGSERCIKDILQGYRALQ